VSPRPQALRPHAAILVAVVLLLALLPTAWIERGPSPCLIRLIFGSCPACGSVRALSHFLHGCFREALRYNWNVLITAPLLLWLAADAVLRLARSCRGAAGPDS
jgi:hypothetical protein